MAEPKPNPSPAPAVRKKFILRRIFPSTWLVLLLGAGVLLLVEVPGRRTGFTTYAHGWPLAYLERDYWQDTGQLSPPADRRLQEQEWECNGLSWGFEQQLSPWSVANMTRFSTLSSVADMAMSAFLLMALAWSYQRWRQRRVRLVQFRLSTLLAAVAILGVVCSVVTSWIREKRADQQAAAELLNDIGYRQFDDASQFLTGLGPNPSITADLGWDPPAWLPESLLKLGHFAELFQRVYYVRLENDDKATAAALERATYLRGLRHLELVAVTLSANALAHLERQNRLTQFDFASDNGITDDALTQLVKLPNLKRLTFSCREVADPQLERLATLTELTDLSLSRAEGSEGFITLEQAQQLHTVPPVTASGIHQLLKMPRLRVLKLGSMPLDDSALAALNELHMLEELELDGVPVHRLEMHGLSRLRILRANSADHAAIVRLESLPALEILNIAGRPTEDSRAQQFRFRDVPRLKSLWLEELTLDEVGWTQARGLPNLEELKLNGVDFKDSALLEIQGLRSLQSLNLGNLKFAEIRVEGLPSLEQLEVWDSESLTKLALRQLPRLDDLEIKYVPRLEVADFEGLERLRHFAFNPTDSFGARHGPPLEFRGLAKLSSLEELGLSGIRLGAAKLAAIPQLTRITSLDLSDTDLQDKDIELLKHLTRLRLLRLDDTAISDAEVNSLMSLTQLRCLSIDRTQITPKGKQQLQAALPNTLIDASWTRQCFP